MAAIYSLLNQQKYTSVSLIITAARLLTWNQNNYTHSDNNNNRLRTYMHATIYPMANRDTNIIHQYNLLMAIWYASDNV